MDARSSRRGESTPSAKSFSDFLWTRALPPFSRPRRERRASSAPCGRKEAIWPTRTPPPGLSAAEQYRRESGEVRPTVALSTASPFKFAAAMLSSLGKDVPEDGFAALDALCAFAGTPIPAPLDALRARAERFKAVVNKDEMRESVKNWLVKWYEACGISRRRYG